MGKNKQPPAESGETKIIAIVGPTSSGKSAFAVELTRAIGGEIISADSRQVYRGMDLGTGKITKREMRGVRHFGLDIASPRAAAFNVSKFKTAAQRWINEITKRGHVPVLVGGTGFWIDAVAFNLDLPDIPPNARLRNRLNRLSAEQLFKKLSALDSARAERIDRQNKRRLVRAIEIAMHRGFTARMATNPNQGGVNTSQQPQTLFIGLDLPNPKLQQRILKRIEQRLKRGMVAEVQRLHNRGVSWKTLENFGLEYRFIAEYLQRKIDASELRQAIFTGHKHYVKRQRTWFKRNKNIVWFNPEKKSAPAKALRLVKKFLGNPTRVFSSKFR